MQEVDGLNTGNYFDFLFPCFYSKKQNKKLLYINN